MGYGEKVKKWFFDEDGDGEDIAEDYDAVEVDTVPKTSLFEQAKLSKTSEAVKSLNMNKDSHLFYLNHVHLEKLKILQII